ncbi:MAG: cation-translocating P-type ATPase [Bacteroidales bacterium]|nr:cation-translocating P-type ATPase [Bacteroidales bacterium]
MNIESNKYKGLTDEEVVRKHQQEGYNELPSSKTKSIWGIALGILKEPMFILLVACGTLYLLLGDIQEGIMLMGFVVVIMGIEFFQERKTEKALDALKDLASPRAVVVRNGIEQRIAGREVVTDDIIVLREGDRVPADAIVLSCVNLLVDESLLTGESVSVHKTEFTGSEEDTHPDGDNRPFVYSGSMIVQGSGMARVSAIGIHTQIGHIGRSLEEVKEEPTKLNREIGSLVKKLTIFGAVLCLLVVGLYYLTRGDLLQGFLAGITLAMAMLPEEFPVVLTIFLALGAWRISKKNVLTRRPAVIESLGSATVLCTDKTGTLTQNKMTVTCLYNGDAFFTPSKTESLPEEFHEIIEYGILSSQIDPFDPMEKAITKMGTEQLSNTEHIHHDWKMVKEYPLSKELLAMSRVFTCNNCDWQVVAAKGAPEAIFDLCHLSVDEQQRLAKEVETMANAGLRVLGVAKGRIETLAIPEIQHDFDFEFVGLIGLADPIRDNVPLAVEECHKAGIRVIMITGDYPVTAKNIGRQIGLNNWSECITGFELKTMSDEELSRRIQTVNIFARVVPEQKLKIVNALKQNDEVVAMTGDGVNDAPALKSAHIGIAMGEKGTDVAREASSLVLLDDNFASIVGAVKMGRRICDNLQKALAYIFAIHVPIAGLSLIPVFFGNMPLLLWPVHIVFLELIIDPACSIIFEAEKEEDNIMQRPPKSRKEAFFTGRKILISCMQGISILAIVLAIYLLGLFYWNMPEGQARALSFIALIAGNIGVIFTNRSWSKNIFQILATHNGTVKWMVVSASLFLVLANVIPFLQNLFQFDPITIWQGVLSALCGFFGIFGFEWYKWRMKNRAIKE